MLMDMKHLQPFWNWSSGLELRHLPDFSITLKISDNLCNAIEISIWHTMQQKSIVIEIQPSITECCLFKVADMHDLTTIWNAVVWSI